MLFKYFNKSLENPSQNLILQTKQDLNKKPEPKRVSGKNRLVKFPLFLVFQKHYVLIKVPAI